MSIDNQNPEAKDISTPSAQELSQIPTIDSTIPETTNFLTEESKSEERTAPQPATIPEMQRTGLRGLLDKPLGKAAAVVAGLLVVGGVAGGITAANQAPAPQTTSSAGPNPAETPTSAATPESTPSAAETVPDVSTKMELGQSPEAYAQLIDANYNNWIMSGSKTIHSDWLAEVTKTGDASNETRVAFLKAVAEKNKLVYAPDLFGPNFAADEAISALVDNIAEENASNLDLVIVTSSSDEANHNTPFVRSIKFANFDSSQVKSQAADGSTLALERPYTEITNASLNKAEEYIKKSGDTDVNGILGTMTTTLVATDGQMILKTFHL